ncbi:MAG: NAD(P)H-hydrate dehydratase [Bacilli bacterium]|nr:NAD(P)H-hydrate dehydratase [Bacilli bacterium]MDD4345039.1 NAD(P)H-hydrate dehydratase [Bacilli bacterium]MDD4521080.1 NAD(P)H-hydrate dehydratase [Bacilli bacterium]
MKQLLELDLPQIPFRRANTHKYDYGSLLVIGGSIGFFGAPQLASKASLRLGVGLVTLALPQEIYYRFEPQFFSQMIFPFAHPQDIVALLKKKTAVVFGPGLDSNIIENLEILKLLLAEKIPLVIDAGGLDIFKPLLDSNEDFSQVVITPHLGEAKRLLDDGDPLVNYSRLTINNLTLVLKGPTTLIAHKDQLFEANQGSSAMAKAGMGDVLAGMIGALLAQGYTPLEAAKLATYLHQEAARIAINQQGKISLISEDVIDALPIALNNHQ